MYNTYRDISEFLFCGNEKVFVKSIIKSCPGVPSHLKPLLDESFTEAVNSCGAEEIQYVHSKLPRKVAETVVSSTVWVASLAKLFWATYTVLCNTEESKGYHHLDVRRLTACLTYFINPFDFIPDHDSIMGYADDAYIFRLCQSSLTQDTSVAISEALSRIPEEASEVVELCQSSGSARNA